MSDITLDRGAGVSLWRQIQEWLAKQIAEGTLEPGTRLPTEHELAASLDVNRHTVRRAMKVLEDQGLIRIEQGRGTFVCEQVIDYPVGRRTRFSDNLAAQNRQPGGRLLATKHLAAPAHISEALNLASGSPLSMIRTMGEADGRPVSFADHYFDAQRFPDISVVFAGSRSISRALAEFGVADYFRKVTRVTARIPTKQQADLLQQPANRPILVTESINIDTDGMPVEYGVAHFAADRVHLLFEP